MFSPLIRHVSAPDTYTGLGVAAVACILASPNSKRHRSKKNANVRRPHHLTAISFQSPRTGRRRKANQSDVICDVLLPYNTGAPRDTSRDTSSVRLIHRGSIRPPI